MPDIEFDRIAARSGSQSNAFEELCSQIARRTCPIDAPFERFRGAGGDGGVECIARLANGSMTGWQAKFVFHIDSLIAQTEVSLQTALSTHENLKKYIVCFPFDPTGKTARTTKRGRSAKSQSEKLNHWIANAIKKAKSQGRDLRIECWPASRLKSLLLEHDSSGGMRHYFFSEKVLSAEWFKSHLATAAKAAGPRYTPELNVQTALWAWLSAFEGGAAWRESLEPMLEKCSQATKRLQRQAGTNRGDPANPPWPAGKLQASQDALNAGEDVLSRALLLGNAPADGGLDKLLDALDSLLSAFRKLEARFADELDSKHGAGSANSEGFRSWMAQYQQSFPAANLDVLRSAAAKFDALRAWLRSPFGYLALKKVFVLSGAGGTGKTHGICDAALQRLKHDAYSCVLFGHQFSGEPAVWTRLIESLGLPTTIGKDGVLDALNAAAEASERPLIFFIDALNETRPRDYWLRRFAPLAHDFEQRPFLKLCVSCKTSFLSACLPQSNPYCVVEHKGFVGIERQACNAFFQHYDLAPPLTPILLPELSNPLYLKLVCETLSLKGLKRLPNGWLGLAPVIDAFLSEKERQFASEHPTSVGAAIVKGSLLAIVSAVANSASGALPWSEAKRVVDAKRPLAATLPVLDWLVKADLLIEDGPTATAPIDSESVLRPAFERFGDFLVAAELLPNPPPKNAAAFFKTNSAIKRLLKNPESVNANTGIISALSILLPETAGVELPNLIKNAPVREATLALTIRALPWRTPDTFTDGTRDLAREALTKDARATMDSLMAICAQPSKIDAYWFCRLLASLRIAKRDGIWCAYLHEGFEQNGIVKRLIEASSNIDLRRLDLDTASRWALMLLWFTAAADRRVKDRATRATIAIFRAKSDVIPPLVDTLCPANDDAVRERVLLCAYGALISSRDAKTLKSVAESLLCNYQSEPTAFQNAIIRDHIRCIGELARELGCLNARFDPQITSAEHESDWPLRFPTETQLKRWHKDEGAMYHLTHSCLHDDFKHYSIGCLNAWAHKMDQHTIGTWIIRHVVEEFGFEAGNCDNYDKRAAYTGGGGRAKPAWAERIGKKYQWIALYRLASRLADNVARRQDSLEPKPVRTPLILMEERKLDPTLSHTSPAEEKPSRCWWIGGTVDLSLTKTLSLASWVKKRDDLPLLDTFLRRTVHAGQRWIVLTTYPTWSEYRRDLQHSTPYRLARIDLRSYLVPKGKFKETIAALDERNYLGDWLPRGGDWLHAFAGEYPWSTACNTDPDWYLGARETVRGSSLEIIPSANQIVIEWEYDATLPTGVHLQVPTKRLFAQRDLWWNGTDGFLGNDGKTVFRDPQLTEGGPATLLADMDDLIPRLARTGYRLVWTMVGEKLILGGKEPKTPNLTFSQMAVLNENGSITFGKRSFSNHPGKDQGLLTDRGRRRSRRRVRT